jgi:hypothetical protein
VPSTWQKNGDVALVALDLRHGDLSPPEFKEVHASGKDTLVKPAELPKGADVASNRFGRPARLQPIHPTTQAPKQCRPSRTTWHGYQTNGRPDSQAKSGDASKTSRNVTPPTTN